MFFHQLEMTNVGPFAGAVNIDLAAVAQSGLFLLEGPTGSGKSTILDAIVFALYGDVGVPHANTDRMRSSFATASEASEVALVFETNAGVFRIQRTPAYDRAKKSGLGTTRQNSTVKLWRLSNPEADPVDAPLSTRHGEAEAEILRIVGLNRAQFVQTILLPQGEFANFLRSKPENRRELLQKIFGTDLYDRIASELDGQRRQAQSERAKAQERVGHMLTAFIATVDASAEQADVLREANPSDLPGLVSKLAEQYAVEATAAEALVGECQTAYLRAEAELGRGEALLERRRREDELEARRDALNTNRAVELAKRNLLHDLVEVAAVSPIHHTMTEAVEAAEAAMAAYTARIREFEAENQTAITDPSGQAQHLRLEIQSLAEPLLHESQLPEVSSRLEDEQRELDRLTAQQAELQNQAVELPGRISKLLVERDSIRSLAAQVPLLRASHEDAARRVAAAREVAQLTAEVTQRSLQVADAELRAKAASAEHNQLQQDRINGIAGELATGLVDGAPCVVCGSLEHPQPNRGVGTVDLQLLEYSAKKVEACVAELEDEVAGRNLVDNALAAAIAQAGERSVSELDADLAGAHLALTRAMNAQDRLEGVEGDLSTAEHGLAGTTSALEAARSSISTQTRSVDALTTQVEALRGALEKARAGADSVAARVADLTILAEELEDLARSAESLRVQKSTAETCRASWRRARQSIRISDGASVDELLSRSAEIEPLREELADLDREHAVVDAGLAEIAALDRLDASAELSELPAIEELRARSSSALEARDRSRTNFEAIRSLVGRTQSCVDDLRTAIVTLEGVIVSTAEIIRLSEIANATSLANAPRISLPTYVLMSRFQDVISAANSRLQTMSDGRYTLVHSFEKETQGKKSGLGIVVRDHHAECDRSPGNLSGGETFYTSLALALGLADVVTAEAGGVDLGTLFIDEGFGALDPETLDSVLAEIARLRQAGRVVGVVSHVDELKLRIPDRIEVRRLPSGRSTIKIVA